MSLCKICNTTLTDDVINNICAKCRDNIQEGNYSIVIRDENEENEENKIKHTNKI